MYFTENQTDEEIIVGVFDALAYAANAQVDICKALEIREPRNPFLRQRVVPSVDLDNAEIMVVPPFSTLSIWERKSVRERISKTSKFKVVLSH